MLNVYENSVKFAPKYKFLVSNNKTILTYWPFTLFMNVILVLLNSLLFQSNIFNELQETFEY